MNEKTIATIALPDKGLLSLSDTLKAALGGVEAAAAQGTHLAVLPETINLLHLADSGAALEDCALEDWREDTAILREAAARANISLVLPLLVRENGLLANRFYLLSSDGSELGFYQKRVPAPGERASGVEPGFSTPIAWEGLQVGGAICFDIYYPQQVLDPQAEAGADLFVVPSFTPAGSVLDFCAVNCGVPIVLAYSPWSRILDRDGREVAAGGYRSETLRSGFGSPIVMATINFDAVTLFADFNQLKMREVQRRYGHNVRIRFDQSNCLFTLESRAADLTVKDVMREFELISRRDYFARNGPAIGKDPGWRSPKNLKEPS